MQNLTSLSQTSAGNVKCAKNLTVNGALIGGGPSDVGNVYYVILSSKAFYSDFYNSRQGNYSDGSAIVYPDAGTGDGILAAIAACKGGRNDYVIVGTGTYTMTAAIDLVGKSSLHLIAANGGGMPVGSPGAVIIHQNGNYSAVKMNAFCELAGFQIENMTGYNAIEVPTNLAWVNIHHNLIKWQTSAGVDAIFGASNGGSYGSVHHNKIVQWSGTGGRAGIYFGNAATVCMTISDNEIIAYGGSTFDYGILYTGAGGMVRDNYISESGGSAAGGGTVTVGIEVGVNTAAISNRVAVAAGQGLAGGTANRTFVDNKDALNGGAVEIVT